MDINILLFPDFETLDAFGPVEVLGRVSGYALHFVSMGGGLVTSRQKTPIMTESMDQANAAGILLIPGGQGTRPLVQDEDFIGKLKYAAEQAAHCLTVCTGSALLARTELLNGRKATSNKIAFDWVKSVNSAVHWIEHARWVTDGKYYTSSGISAGIDMTLGFIADQYGSEQASDIAHGIEYVWNSDKTNDPFSRKKY
ncbi:DJ-1/PfpI family protein [Sporolactobacillus shoreicorticis]|uniref:DJ-1/PfpI family protein n=1 Tax=Sporolactobacillus shoreicorticis TaxID=1923877 RepID=A0ABW5S1V3_9BACL|nr:DJ-1/PfpI family protein [Sporolactobacillus shoreicorticis]MCO7125377.1 DJ-1/PfpI family protein [Sporolactobacillus shoreicorticis]